jgi:hypothetical protein
MAKTYVTTIRGGNPPAPCTQAGNLSEAMQPLACTTGGSSAFPDHGLVERIIEAVAPC